MRLRVPWIGLLLGVVIILAGLVFARSKQDDDFPDYNKLEYAKERPPADKQVADDIPGSIQMRVGEKKAAPKGTPIEELPVPIRRAATADTTEPPLDFIDAVSPTAVAVVSTTAVTNSTAPAR